MMINKRMDNSDNGSHWIDGFKWDRAAIRCDSVADPQVRRYPLLTETLPLRCVFLLAE